MIKGREFPTSALLPPLETSIGSGMSGSKKNANDQKVKDMYSSRRNYTLIELLITIAIIVILAGLLLPALKNSRDRVKSISCANNFKQINLAFTCYTGDYNDYYPNWRWQDALTPYIPDAQLGGKTPCGICPASPLAMPSGTYQGAILYSHYVYNGVHYDSTEFFSCYGKDYFIRATQVKNPSRKFVATECWIPANMGGIVWGSNRVYTFCTVVHFGGTNFLFADGHVSWLRIMTAPYGEIADPVAAGALEDSQKYPKY